MEPPETDPLLEHTRDEQMPMMMQKEQASASFGQKALFFAMGMGPSWMLLDTIFIEAR